MRIYCHVLLHFMVCLTNQLFGQTPQIPQNVKVVSEGLYLKVEWDDKNADKSIYYIIIRTESADIHDDNHVEFTKFHSPLYDNNAKLGRTYYYHVIAARKGTAAFSEPSQPKKGKLLDQAGQQDTLEVTPSNPDTTKKRRY